MNAQGTKNLTIEEIVERVKKWQESKHVHPLTCGKELEGNEKPHPLLHSQVRTDTSGKEVITLVCDQCDFEQDWIPKEVLEADL